MNRKEAQELLKEARKVGWPIVRMERAARGVWHVEVGYGTAFDGTPGIRFRVTKVEDLSRKDKEKR